MQEAHAIDEDLLLFQAWRLQRTGGKIGIRYFMLIAVPVWIFFWIALGIVTTPQAAMLGGAPSTAFGQLGFFVVPGFFFCLAWHRLSQA